MVVIIFNHYLLGQFILYSLDGNSFTFSNFYQYNISKSNYNPLFNDYDFNMIYNIYL